MNDLRADTGLSQEDRRAKMKTIRDDTTAKMKDNPDARTIHKWQKMGPGGRAARNRWRRGGGTPPPPGATNSWDIPQATQGRPQAVPFCFSV